MTTKSDALEQAVTDFITARTALDSDAGARARMRVDRAFARLAALLAPRVRYLTRRYGLAGHAEDAEQACAIAIHHAAGRYDPARARFTTYVTWQLRAELQALRLRLYGDRRHAGRGAISAMLSLDTLVDQGAADWLADPAAEAACEEAASARLAALCADRLVADWAARRESALARTPLGRAAPRRIAEKVAAEKRLVRRQLAYVDTLVERLNESDRHLVRRAFSDMARRAAATRH